MSMGFLSDERAELERFFFLDDLDQQLVDTSLYLHADHTHCRERSG